MSSTLLQLRQEYKECLVCQKTLGYDSRESGLMFCHEHILCSACKKPLMPREAQWCVDRYHELLGENQERCYPDMDIIHIQCAGLAHKVPFDKDVPVKSSDLDFLNMIRLMVMPDINLSLLTNENNAMLYSTRLMSDMDFEQKSLHLKMMEACVANASIVVRQDPKYRKEALAEREKKHFDRASKEALTSSRPVTKAVNDDEEIILGKFMESHGLLERKTAKKILKQRNDTIANLVKIGVPPDVAAAGIDGDMLKSGVYKK